MYNLVAQMTISEAVRAYGFKAMRERGEQVDENDSICAYAPFYHASAPLVLLLSYTSWMLNEALVGQHICCFTPASRGQTTYIMSTFSFDAFLSHIQKYKITQLVLVPPIAVLFAKHPAVKNFDLSSIRSALCGAAPLGADVQQAAELAIDPSGKMKIQQGYGMTELTTGAAFFPPGERDPEISGVGYLLPNMRAKIVGDDGSEKGYDEEGELVLQGPNVFSGYWKREEATRETFTSDGWLKTGDIAVFRKTGVMHIVDRKKELIKVRGMFRP